jgi:Protein of unknown function (DUF3489)
MTGTNETTATSEKAQTKRPRKMAREPKASVAGTHANAEATLPSPKRESKTDLLLRLLKRQEGATIEQLAASTGWLPHSSRAALTGLKKKGHVVTSEKLEGQGRVYRVAAA